MVDVEYTADPHDLDRAPLEAQAERPDRPVRIRLQPTILRKSGAHLAWKGVAWTIACPTAEDAIDVRLALEAFFACLGQYGTARVRAVLTAIPESD